MKKSLTFMFLSFLLLIMLVVLTGCTRTYTIDDIKSYIENDIGITGYELSDTATEKNDGKYTDYYWHVKYKDIEFDVINDYYWAQESLCNSLTSNYKNQVMDYFYENYNNKEKITYKEDFVYKENTIICEVADENKEVDLEKLKADYEDILDFVNSIDFEQYPIKTISVEVTNKDGHVKWLHVRDNNVTKTYEEFIEEL